ncbi:hypothetical protein ACFRCI_38015 [Streptomyces sp. NPDC056638]|uniref:DUF6197 family protein n=1 Tax=Streptomyces sp. NPDC056638 TaxID=3345887 RepID=UPI0036CFDB13
MPKTTNTPSAAAAVFTDETLSKAAELAADAHRPLWTGPSGEESSGEAVARHLEATIALLERDGWVRTYDSDAQWSTNPVLDTGESATVESMLRSLLDLVREETAGTGDPRRSLFTALRHVSGSDHGDSDTCDIAAEILALVIRAHTGSATAHATQWSERLTRTYADITALLTVGARFARTYGPGAAVSGTAAA